MTEPRFVRNPNLMAEITRRTGAGIRAVGAYAVEEAQSHAPVGDPAIDEHSGQLRDSIHFEEVDETTVAVVADAPESVFVEFGTRFMSPEPFMAPAMMSVRSRGEDMLARAAGGGE